MTTIIRSTAKAHLVEVDGVQAWIKAAWLRADGTLTPAGVKAIKAAEAANTNTVNVHVAKQSEKAIAFYGFFTEGGYNSRTVEWEEDEQMKLVWMPKAWLASLTTNERGATFAAFTEATLAKLRREKGNFALDPAIMLAS